MTDCISRGLRYILRGVVRVYQATLSPLFLPCCRFVPSCSDYALEVLERKALFEALWLIVRRLSRCHPLCRGGFDPVPSDQAGSDVAVKSRCGH